MEITSVLLPDGQTVIVIGGEMQPMTSAGQNEVAEEILRICSEASTPMLLVLAGLASGSEDKGIHVICADDEVRRGLEEDDIPVSRERPEAGMIGVAGLLVSLSSLFGVKAFRISCKASAGLVTEEPRRRTLSDSVIVSLTSKIKSLDNSCSSMISFL